jgi:putative flavoprotein involved in K+ transport
MRHTVSDHVHDVLIVGAGPAGLGTAATLARLGIDSLVVDRHEIGGSFRRWPRGTRLLTPSFTSNGFNLPDLNAITPDTSPAFSLGTEHPTGDQYADYLEVVARVYDLQVRDGIGVDSVVPEHEGFTIQAGSGRLRARFVVWAAGEFLHPRRGGFEGAELATPTSTVPAYERLPGDSRIIIGGYESGMDAALQLVDSGRRVTLLDAGSPWDVVAADPSLALSPWTLDRLRRVMPSGQLELVGDARVTRVGRAPAGYVVEVADGRRWTTPVEPLLATGFTGSVELIADLFKQDEHGGVVVTEEADESTITPGLFLAGPALRHGDHIFCFIYKFRQRFAVVARAIGERLGVDTAPLEDLRQYQFHLDDLSCCGSSCAC